MLLNHLMTNVARKHNDAMVGILKMMLDFDRLHILLADGTQGPEEDLRLAVEAPEASITEVVAGAVSNHGIPASSLIHLAPYSLLHF